jgi:hypothetical protein
LPTRRPSWKSRFGSWQLAHEIRPFALRRRSEKRRRPSAAARESSATALDGSRGGGPSALSDSERSVVTCAADQLG